MSREEFQKYLEMLELDPDASLAEIKKSYLHLKRLYSTESIVISPIADEFPEEKRRDILHQIEEAYANLLALLEKEDKKILEKRKKNHIRHRYNRERRDAASAYRKTVETGRVDPQGQKLAKKF